MLTVLIQSKFVEMVAHLQMEIKEHVHKIVDQKYSDILVKCSDKKNKYEPFIIKLGIFIRILMFIGFTIEFSHQRTVLADIGPWDVKDTAMNQFSNFLFYGYLFIVGIYYIITMSINKFKGFFYYLFNFL